MSITNERKDGAGTMFQVSILVGLFGGGRAASEIRDWLADLGFGIERDAEFYQLLGRVKETGWITKEDGQAFYQLTDDGRKKASGYILALTHICKALNLAGGVNAPLVRNNAPEVARRSKLGPSAFDTAISRPLAAQPQVPSVVEGSEDEEEEISLIRKLAESSEDSQFDPEEQEILKRLNALAMRLMYRHKISADRAKEMAIIEMEREGG